MSINESYISDLHNLKSEYERNSKIILYGASLDGRAAYEILDAAGIRVTYVVDSNLGNSGKYLYKAQIVLPERLKEESGRICLILCSKGSIGEMFTTVKQINHDAEIILFCSKNGEFKKPKNDLEFFRLYQYEKKGEEKDILLLTQRIATKTSASYVYKNMLCVPAFSSHEDLRTYAVSSIKLGGLVLEFGVFEGNSINAISRLLIERLVYGFDSFEGLPEDWNYGNFKGTFDVRGMLPKVNENVVLIKGWFDETLPLFANEHKGEACAFIHIDCDLYASTKTVFFHLHSMITSGTVILFDEYFNYPGWEAGEFKAFKEFLNETGLQYRYIGYVPTREAVAVQII